MQAVPLHIKEANAFIASYHRHSLPAAGGRFAVGVVERGKLVGVAVAAASVVRRLDDGKTLEVLRVCTDGTRYCCSFVYAGEAKSARLFGYTRVIMYSLDEGSGPGWRTVGGWVVGRVEAREWSGPSRLRKSQAVYGKTKVRWEL